jgi:hypothetical protein
MFRATAPAPLMRIVAHAGATTEEWGMIFIEGPVAVGQRLAAVSWARLGLRGQTIALPQRDEDLIVVGLVALDPPPAASGSNPRLIKRQPTVEVHVEVRKPG